MTRPEAVATGTKARFPTQRLALSILACLVLAGGAVALRLTHMNLGDFSSHAAAVQRALAGEPVYTAVQLAGPYSLPDISRGRGFVYPPTAVLLLLPAGLGSGWAVVLLVGSLGLLALVTTEIARREVPAHAWIGWPLAGLLLISPLAADAIDAGQVTPLLAAGYGAAWLRPRLSGYVAVFGGALKLYPLLLLAWAVRNRAAVMVPLGIGLLLAVGATVWLRPDIWLHFWTAWQNAVPQCAPPSLGSLGCSFGRAGELAGIGLAVALAIVSSRVTGPSVAFLLLAVASLIAAPDLFPNYLLIVAVGALPLTCQIASRLLDR